MKDETVGAATKVFESMRYLSTWGVIKQIKLIIFFIETSKWIYKSENCYDIKFPRWKITFIVFYVKDVNKAVP